MTAGGQPPGWTDPPYGTFHAQAGDTMPGQVISGPPSPTRAWPERPAWPGRPRRRRRLGKVIRRTLVVLGVFVLLGVLGFGGLLLLTPSVGDAQALAQDQASSHGVAYPGPPVPAKFAAALVATEDHRFYSDPGIDPFAVGRVAVGYVQGNGSQQGGATITQQLAKMLYTPGQSGLTAEAKQVALAVKLDLTYSKAQILQMYADVAYFGQDYYSLGAASCGYFGVPPAGLTWPQAALMAGIVQAPTAYDPLTDPVNAHAREAHVLSRLAATGTLTQAQSNAALGQSLHLRPAGEGLRPPPQGSSTCGGPSN